jgi:hypothetical protein
MKIKSNDRFPRVTHTAVVDLIGKLMTWDSPYAQPARELAARLPYGKLFILLHAMRRWYSGQTMAHTIAELRPWLRVGVMQLEPENVIGIYRGFKVPKWSPLLMESPGSRVELDVTRNRGVSSWTTREDTPNRFSGTDNERVGVIVKLTNAMESVPILAPPSHTELWFNELYTYIIGTSFRPKEGEYVLLGPKVEVEIVRIKR